MRITSIIENGCLSKRQPFFFTLLLILLLSCSSFEEEIHPDYEVLFTVNDIERTVFDFESEYVRHLIETGRNDTKTERYSFLNQMIDNLLLAEAGAQNGLLDHPKYQAAITFEQRKSMLDFYFMDEMDELIEPPSDEEVRLAYAKKQRKVYVSHLFSKNPNDLIEPYQRLESGERFVDVANDYYEVAEYDSLAGYLGPISYFGVENAFAEAAYSTNLYEYSEPVRSQYGYHIIYVEYIEFPAMLTEDDYQYRKKGIASQVRLRKQQLVSNDYVRSVMESLNVDPNGENILALREAIQNLDEETIVAQNQIEESPNPVWTDDRIEKIASAFDRDAVLASYSKDGNTIDFTFQDYLNWLPYLSFQESKIRTAASIGRGLRNEVLFQESAENNYQEDSRVQGSMEKRGYEILSELYQYNLTLSALSDTSAIEVPNSYRDRLIRNRYVLLKADYWKITASTLQEAESIKQEIDEGTLPISFDTYEQFDFAIVDPSNSDIRVIRQALENRPLLGYSGDNGWFVLQLNNREITEVTDVTESADIEKRFRVFSSINSEVESLREQTVIQIDTVLFNEIYEVWRQKKEEEATE